MTAQRTITLPADQWEAILEAVECHCDEGPPGEGWKSSKLSAASAALRSALAQPEPEGPTDRELVAVLKQAIKDFPPNHPDAKALNSLEYEIEIELRKARAVLARWGHPTLQPVSVATFTDHPHD